MRRGNKRTVQNTASHLYSPGMEQPLTPCTPAAVHPSVHNLLQRFIVCIFFAYQPQLSVIAVSVLRCWLAASTLTDATDLYSKMVRVCKFVVLRDTSGWPLLLLWGPVIVVGVRENTGLPCCPRWQRNSGKKREDLPAHINHIAQWWLIWCCPREGFMFRQTPRSGIYYIVNAEMAGLN